MTGASIQGKVVLITGATNGLGKATALELAKMGAQVVIVGRNPAKTDATLKEIESVSGNRAGRSLIADLSSMREVAHLAEEIKKRVPRLDVLVNNAGAMYSHRRETADGYEATFALNHLSVFLLTNLLLETLRAAPAARIVNITSSSHTMIRKIRFDDLHLKRGNYLGGFPAYGQSKLMNIMFTYELARRLEGSRVMVNCVHPGTANTGLHHHNRGWMRVIQNVVFSFGITPEAGAAPIVHLAASPELEGVTGQYFDRHKPAKSSSVSYDETARRQLWQISERLTGLAPDGRGWLGYAEVPVQVGTQ
jgi:NAD(P)-dependent dehydrogenase (short-subunit alcohol dehydrogenase family)